jgi:hypothetical protein
MTEEEALREARRRWGASGAVQSQEPTWQTNWYRFAVGQRLGQGFRTWGQGDSWEEAFADADKNEEADE